MVLYLFAHTFCRHSRADLGLGCAFKDGVGGSWLRMGM